MKYKGYLGVVELNDDASGFFGRVVGLRDVITFQGTSIEEITKAFRDSVDDYLEFCAERGDSPEKPYSGHFVLRVDPRLHRELAHAAEARHMSLNALVEIFLERVIDALPTVKKATKTTKSSARRTEATYTDLRKRGVISPDITPKTRVSTGRAKKKR